METYCNICSFLVFSFLIKPEVIGYPSSFKAERSVIVIKDVLSYDILAVTKLNCSNVTTLSDKVERIDLRQGR